MQTTLSSSVALQGAGLHTGASARAVLRPAPAGSGIAFRRLDAPDGYDPLVPARWDLVAPSALMTRLVNGSGASVSTVEHLIAAFVGLGVHNALIELDGPEVPILDGSSAPWVHAILDAGIERLGAPLDVLKVLAPVEVRDGAASARIEPAAGPEMAFAIDFPDAAIGRQARALSLANGAFVRELCDSRTFCRLSDVEGMRAGGRALGGTFLNAVVVDGDRVLTPGGLRHPDEPVRHKMLDALGDLGLAGAPILGRYRGHRAGHALTNRLLRALVATPGAVARVRCDEATAARLPGAGVGPADLVGLPAVA